MAQIQLQIKASCAGDSGADSRIEAIETMESCQDGLLAKFHSGCKVTRSAVDAWAWAYPMEGCDPDSLAVATQILTVELAL